MTRLLLFFLSLGLTLNASAQTTYLPIKVKHQWGLLAVTDQDAHFDSTRLYDQLGDTNLPWFGQPGSQSGYYLVEQDGKLGLVTEAFEPVISTSWEGIQPISHDHFLVAIDGRYTIVDSKEKSLLGGNTYEAIRLPKDNSLAFLILKEKGKWGVRKMKEKSWLIQPEYLDLAMVDVGTEGFFKVKTSKEDGNKWRLIDWSGKTPNGFSGTFENLEAASSRHFAIQEISGKTNWSIRDLSGKEMLVLGPQTTIIPLNKHLFGYREGGSNTYTVLVMREEISPLVEKFRHLEYVNEKVAYYKLGRKAGFVYGNGTLAELDLEKTPDVVADTGDLIRLKKDDKWGLYSLKEEKILQQFQFDSIAPFDGLVAAVHQNGKIGLIDQTGTLIAPPRFEEVSDIKVNTGSIYGYWKDSMQVFKLAQNGTLSGNPPMGKNAMTNSRTSYRWNHYQRMTEEAPMTFAASPAIKVSDKKMAYWKKVIPQSPEDTLWIQPAESFWQMIGESYQMMQHEEVEVVVREKSASAKKKKKKKKKGKKPSTPAPKKTKMVMKWVKKGAPFQFLRKAVGIDWTLAYHDNTDLVSNELTYKGRQRFSVRKISIFQNENNTLIPDLEMTGIRLSDFAQGQSYAAFIDLDGKVGLIDKSGQQALDEEGQPLRFTYISQPAEERMQACLPTTAFNQTGIKLAQFFSDFNVEVINRTGHHISELKSDQPAAWGYIDLQGNKKGAFEYELATPFKQNFAINKKGGKWGAINTDNEIVIPFEFDAISFENGYWKVVKGKEEMEDLFFDHQGRRFKDAEQAKLIAKGTDIVKVHNGDNPAKYGFANANGELIIPFQFDQASNFMDGLATVRQGRKWFFIDESGKEAISMDPELIGIMEVGSFNEGLCPIRKTIILNKKPTTKYGYINTEGKLAIPAQFDQAGIFQDGLAIVDSVNIADYKPGRGEGVPRDRGLIDKTGKMITNYEYRRILPFNKAGFAEVVHSRTGKQGVIGKDGQVVTNDYHTRVKSFLDGMAASDGTSWQLYDYSGNPIDLPVANVASITHFADGDLIVKDKSNKFHHLVIRDGNAEIKQRDLHALLPFEHDYAFAKTDKKGALYGRNQSWIQAEKGQNIKFWSDKFIGIKSRSGEYYANLGLQNIFNRNFDAIDKFRDGAAIVSYSNKKGVINRNGMFVIPPKFHAISHEKEGFFKVQSPGLRYGLHSKDGKAIVPAQYDTIEFLDNGIIKVEYADFVGYYRENGEALWALP